jgi:CRP-like cAMP-binding protein
MRAARAVKDFRESSSNLLDDLEKNIQESDGALLTYITDRVSPLLKWIVSELCSKQPENVWTSIGLGLLEKSGAPESILESIRSWCQDGASIVETYPFDETSHSSSAVPLCASIDAAPPAEKDEGEQRVVIAKCKTVGAEITMPSTAKSADSSPRRPSILKKSKSLSDMTKARKVSIFAAPEDIKVKEKRSSKSDVDGGVNDSDEDSAAEEDEESPKGDESPKNMMRNKLQRLSYDRPRAAPLRDNRRRFTVSLPSMKLPMPPIEDCLGMLRKIDTFSHYSEEELLQIVEIMDCRKFDLDENIVSAGLASESLHIVVGGVGKVSVPKQVGQVNVGDVFGEEALQLAGAISPSQVQAVGGPITTISVPAELFNKLDMKPPVQKMSRKVKTACAMKRNLLDVQNQTGVSQDSGLPILADYEQTAADRELIMLAIKSNKVLSEVLQLNDQQYNIIADNVHCIRVPKGEVLIHKGDTGMALYILQEGLLDVYVSGEISEGPDLRIRPGDSFGELALLYDTPRAATISAVRDCTVWVLERSRFKIVTRMNYSDRLSQYMELMEGITCLQSMVDKSNYDLVAELLDEVFATEGEELCTLGEDPGFLFIIFEGVCEACSENGTKLTLKRGDWIGEKQLVENIPAEHTVRVVTDTATALLLDRNSLHLVTKAAQSLLKNDLLVCDGNGQPPVDHIAKEQYVDNFTRRRFSTFSKNHMTKVKPKSAPDEASIQERLRRSQSVGILGEGSFGTVILLVDPVRSENFALKCLSKRSIVRESLSKNVANERSVLCLLNSPFVVGLVHAYQNRDHLFFLLEAVMGGELFDVYINNGFFGKLGHAKFYGGCITLALNHLHSHRVVYRDLKLENCLLDANGYVKLTDMGIAKLVMGKTYTMVGTADYFAPETLKQSGYNRAVDWWATGVILFIMVAGRSPFDATDVTAIYKNIMKGFSQVKFPSNFNSDLIYTIKSLCRKRPEERAPMLKGGINNLISMPFFSDLDFEKLEKRAAEAPWIPPACDLEKISERKVSDDINLNLEDIYDWYGSMPDTVPEE